MKTNHTCKGCQRSLPLSAYGIRLNYGKNGGHKRRSRCKRCEADYGKLRRENCPDKVKATKKRYQDKNPDKVRRWGLRSGWRRHLGLDPDKVELSLKTHNGLCDICGNSPNGKSLAIDHCHDTKTFRGVLCSHCNIGLGHFKNNPDLLDKAKLYLNSHKASLAV
jgi:hypothetical protein